MGNITLTKMLMAALISTFVVTTLFGSYLGFCNENSCIIQEPYNSAFKNISEQYSSFSTLSGQASDKGLVTNILNFVSNAITGTVNVFITGLGAISKFFEMIPIVGAVFEALNSVFPFLSGLIFLLGTVITLYISMRYIQSASNKFDLP